MKREFKRGGILIVAMLLMIFTASCAKEQDNSEALTDSKELVNANSSDEAKTADGNEESDSDLTIRDILKGSGMTDEEIDEFLAEQEQMKEADASIISSFTIESDNVTSIRIISEGVVGPTYQYTFTLEDNQEEYRQICDIVEGTYQYIGRENPLLGGGYTVELYSGDELLWKIMFSGGNRIYYEGGYYVQTDDYDALNTLFEPYYVEENLVS